MYTSIFKVLSNKYRLLILLLIKDKDLCVCELQGILKLPQYQTSKYLAQLKKLDLISSYRINKYSYYRMKDNQLIHQILKLVESDSVYMESLQIDKKATFICS